MINPLAELLKGAIQARSDAQGPCGSVADKSFQDIFNKIQETTRESEKYSSPDKPRESSQAVSSEKERPTRVDEPARQEKNEDREVSSMREEDEKRAVSGAQAAEKDGQEDKSAGEKEPVEKLAELIKEKLAEIKKKDPETFEKLIEGIDGMSIEEFLTAIGIGEEEIAAMGELINLDAKLTDKFRQALLSGGKDDLAVALRELGLDEKSAARILAALEKTGNSSGAVKTGAESENQEAGAFGKVVEQAKDKKRPASPKHGGNKAGADKAAEAQARMNDRQDTAKAPQTAQQNAAGKAIQNNQQAAAGRAAQNSGGAQSDAQGAMDFRTSNASQGKAESSHGAQRHAQSARTFERMLMNQIVEKVRISIRANGRSHITIKLDPPSLGKIDMRVMTHENQVRAVMVAESREVKMVIERDIDSLRNTLNNNGLKVDQITVTTAGEDSRPRFENFAQNAGANNGGRQGGNSGAAGTHTPGSVEGMETAPPERVSYHDGVLDVVA